MKFNFDKFIHRPSFYFLAYQGFLIFLAGFLPIIFYTFYGHSYMQDLEDVLSITLNYSLGWQILELPFILVCSTFTYIFWNSLNKKKVLFSPIITIFNIILLSFSPAIDAHQQNYNLSGLSFAASIAAIYIPFITILFTLVPYFILRYQEKKHNLTIENPPFAHNKILLYTSLWGIGSYIFITVVIIIVLIFSLLV
jgi:hypothetical protein